MDVFANTVETECAHQQYEPLAKYYSSKHRDNIMAGKFYYLNGEYKTVSRCTFFGCTHTSLARVLWFYIKNIFRICI